MIDPILEDLHATRERLLLASGGTLEGLVARLQREQTESGRTLWIPRRSPVDIEMADSPQSEIESIPATQ